MGFRTAISGAVLAALTLGSVTSAETLPPRDPSPLTVRQIHSGHSLTDSYARSHWPGRLIVATGTQAGTNPHETIASSTIPGSPLHWRWNNPTDTPDARKDIGRYELLVTTESVPLAPREEDFQYWTLSHLDQWVAHAWKKGNGGKGAEVMLYSTWNGWRVTGQAPDYDTEADIPFRKRLDIDGKRWERMQDHANANRPAGMPPVYMIPGHRLMMRLYDDIAAGKAPGLQSIGDLFRDDIHPNLAGEYAIGALVYAVIYQRNPTELPDVMMEDDRAIPPATARYLKNVAWEVATSYPRTGLR